MERRRLLICTTLIFGLAACGGGDSGGSGGGQADAGTGGGGAGKADAGGGAEPTTPAIVRSGDGLGAALAESSRDSSAVTSKEIQLALNTAPAAAVTVTMKADVEGKLSFSPTSFTLSDTDPQTVKVTVLADEDTTDDTVKISAEASGYANYEATVKIVDKTITIAAIADLSLSAGSVDFSVKPSAPGTITVTRPDTEAGNSILLQDEADHVRTLEFTDTEAQDVTVNPADTGLSGEIPLTVAGAYLFPVTVTVNYTAQQNILIYAAETGGAPLSSIRLSEGVERTIYVQLATAPEVGIELNGSVLNENLLTVSNTLEFDDDNWNTRQPLLLTPSYDDSNLMDDTTTLMIGGLGISTNNYQVTIEDHQIQLHVSFPDRPSSYATSSLPLQEGGPEQQICFSWSRPKPEQGKPLAARVRMPRDRHHHQLLNYLDIEVVEIPEGQTEGCGTISAKDEDGLIDIEDRTISNMRFELLINEHSYAHLVLPEIVIQDDEKPETSSTPGESESTSYDVTPSGQLVYNPRTETLGMAAMDGSTLRWYSMDVRGESVTAVPLYDGQSAAATVGDGVLAAYSLGADAFYRYYVGDWALMRLETSQFTSTIAHLGREPSIQGAMAEDGARLRHFHRTEEIGVFTNILSFQTADNGASVQISSSHASQLQLVRTAAGSYTAIWLNDGTPYCRQVTLNSAGTPEAAGDAAVDLGSDLATSIDALAASASTGGKVAVVYKTEAGNRYSFVELDADCTNVGSASLVGQVNKSAPKLYFNGVEHRLLTETSSQLDVYNMSSEAPTWSSSSGSGDHENGAMVWAQDRWVLRYYNIDMNSALMLTTGAF